MIFGPLVGLPLVATTVFLACPTLFDTVPVPVDVLALLLAPRNRWVSSWFMRAQHLSRSRRVEIL